MPTYTSVDNTYTYANPSSQVDQYRRLLTTNLGVNDPGTSFIIKSVKCNYLYTIQTANTLEYIYPDEDIFLNQGNPNQYRSVFTALNATNNVSPIPYYLLWQFTSVGFFSWHGINNKIFTIKSLAFNEYLYNFQTNPPSTFATTKNGDGVRYQYFFYRIIIYLFVL